jgi:hypothetical protein
MSEAGIRRAEEFSWPRVTAKVDDYYGFVIRRLAAMGPRPPHFSAEIPAPARAAVADDASSTTAPDVVAS